MNIDAKALSLIELLKDADNNEEKMVEKFIEFAIKDNAIHNDIYRGLWQIYKVHIDNPVSKSQACSALKILRICTEHSKSHLVKEEETLRKMTLSEIKNSTSPDYNLIKEEIKAWEKVTHHDYEGKLDINDHLFKLMIGLLENFGTKDMGWQCAAEQFINTIFIIKGLEAYKKGELFLHCLIKKYTNNHDGIIQEIEKELGGRDILEIDINESFIEGTVNPSQEML